MEKRFAIVEDTNVINIGISASAMDNTWIETDIAQIGWTYDGENFLPPDPALIAAQQAIDARRRRNALLSMCDWTQVADAPVDRAAWANYRQQLRDITSQSGFPTEINWPQAPEKPGKTLLQRIGSLFTGQ